MRTASRTGGREAGRRESPYGRPGDKTSPTSPSRSVVTPVKSRSLGVRGSLLPRRCRGRAKQHHKVHNHGCQQHQKESFHLLRLLSSFCLPFLKDIMHTKLCTKTSVAEALLYSLFFLSPIVCLAYLA